MIELLPTEYFTLLFGEIMSVCKSRKRSRQYQYLSPDSNVEMKVCDYLYSVIIKIKEGVALLPLLFHNRQSPMKRRFFILKISNAFSTFPTFTEHAYYIGHVL